MKKFIGKLADFCGGYARLAVIAIVAMLGVIAIIFSLSGAEKIFVVTPIAMMFLFAFLGKYWIEK
ncbi:hypothetical protein BZ419_22510 [Salmonella enterica subsp. enterica serovar Enteritidis]|nr:hypothetical protein [Salmonella enterica subsp. enterica serovar Enteritidis]